MESAQPLDAPVNGRPADGEIEFAPEFPTLAELLDELAAFVRRFVVVRQEQADALALWIAHTHAVKAADTTPYIAITSAEKKCGKTQLLLVLGLLVRSPLPTANISDAALFRAIQKFNPTLLFDEVDAIFGPRARDREDLRGILNAGYRLGAVVHRMGGANKTTLETFAVFCPKAFAAIGRLPDTVADRSITIRLERKTAEEPIERFRARDVEPEAELLRDKVAAWIEPHVDELYRARPHLPNELDDRAQDGWEPLLAIADRAGADWPKRGRRAALSLSNGEEREDDSLTARLLADIHQVFETLSVDSFRTADLIDELSKIEESPWGDWRQGKPITPQGLSKLLSPHRITTRSIWIEGAKARGYQAEQFAEAWHRVLGIPPSRVGGGRGGRGGRSGLAPHLRPTGPTAPTGGYTTERPLPGDEGFTALLDHAFERGQLTEQERRERRLLHLRLVRCRELAWR